MNITCRNCGSNTHTTNNCRNPVTSYGVILFRYDNKIPKILMINRKDSLCYIDFMRGKYNINNIHYIQILINKFSNSEKVNIITKDYDTLWKDLWLITEIENKFLADYNKGKEKFNIIKEGFIDKTNQHINLEYLVKQSKTNYDTPEWEFPKGRRNTNETNKNCAIREFKEETNYDHEDYELIINIQPFSENYVGENKVKYRHIYYIGYLKNKDKSLLVNKENLDQCLEVSNIKWLTMDESLSYIRNYHKTRKTVIHKIFNFIDKLEDYIII